MATSIASRYGRSSFPCQLPASSSPTTQLPLTGFALGSSTFDLRHRQPPSKLRSAQLVTICKSSKKSYSGVATCANGQERPFPARSPLYLMKKKCKI